MPIKKHDNNNKKQLVGSLGREGNKPAATECILKQFVPPILAVEMLEIIFSRNLKKKITFQNSCVEEGNFILRNAAFVLP